jgi:hypothetical protein
MISFREGEEKKNSPWNHCLRIEQIKWRSPHLSFHPPHIV